MFLVAWFILSQDVSGLSPAAPSAVPLAVERPLPPAPAELAAPMSCPAFWILYPNGTSEGGVSPECPMPLRETVSEAMALWRFAPSDSPDPITLESTFYLYNPSAPLWMVAGPGDLRTIHWSEAKWKRRVVPGVPEAARGMEGERTCAVKIAIDEKGRVFDVQVVDCPEMFRESAIQASYASSFYPVKVADGEAAPVEFAVRYTFKFVE